MLCKRYLTCRHSVYTPQNILAIIVVTKNRYIFNYMYITTFKKYVIIY